MIGDTTSARGFLPMTRAEARARGWDELDVVIVTGDAYVDHPSFGAALIGRLLEALGHRVGVLAQPDWRSAEAFRSLGRPRLCFGVTAGNLDSMLGRLTAQRANRAEDPYSPGGRPGRRPDRATLVYAHRCREAFPGVPILLGGIEASLRRVAHYDYWSDSVRRSILVDAKADLLLFGMAERAIVEVTRRLAAGEPVGSVRDVPGTALVLRREETAAAIADASRRPGDGRPVVLPSYEEVATDVRAFAEMTRLFHLESNPGNARPLVQRHGDGAVLLNPPAAPLAGSADDAARAAPAEAPAEAHAAAHAAAAGVPSLDALSALPFQRAPHPCYDEPIPALATVRDSITILRGCFGGCAFCSLTEHQGRRISSRSPASVEAEVEAMRRAGTFRGTISDLGGPTANMYRMGCRSPELERRCRRRSCVAPRICAHLETDHGPLVELLRRVRAAPGVRRVLVASGVRTDLADRSPAYVRELAAHHTGGQLSVAPEHASPRVLAIMGKPPIESYERFDERFQAASRAAGREQYLVPYFMSGHPGCTLEDMIELALWLKRRGLRPRQVQEFIPTPSSVATAMYHTGLDPFTLAPVPVARGGRAKRLQKALLLYWDPAQAPLVREALRAAGRAELIGRGPGALVPPDGGSTPAPAPRRRRI